MLLLALIVGTLFAYRWTTLVSFDHPLVTTGEQGDHFNLLAHGFLKGRLSLDAAVPQAIIDSPNPYDPAQRPAGVETLHDASYYRGKYYIYFGPAPVVTLFIPWRLLTGHDLHIAYAVCIFSSGGYLALLALFFLLQRRYFPAASDSAIFISVLALGGATMVFALLRRPNVWELSAAAGFFFFVTSLLCLGSAVVSSRPARWAALGGLALGLAVASRPTYLACAALFALPLLARRRGATRYGWQALFAAATTCGTIGLALLAYNYARFGDALEFGQKYQLSSIIEGNARHFSADYVAINLKIYFFSALRWIGCFPFADGIVVPPAPIGFGGYEFAFGLLPNLPFVLLAVVPLLALALPRVRRAAADPLWIMLALIAAAAALNTAILLFFFGSCIRYMVDFTPCLVLLACVGVLLLDAHLSARFLRALALPSAAILAFFSVTVSALSVVNLYNVRPNTPPSGYAPIARVLNAPVLALDRLRWPDYSPWELRLSFPADRSRREEPLVTISDRGRPVARILVDYLGPDIVRIGYHEPLGHDVALFTPGLSAAPDSIHTLRIQVGDPSIRPEHGMKSWLRLHYDDQPVVDLAAVSLNAFPGRITVGEYPRPEGNLTRFTGRVHSSGPASPTPPARPPLLGARVRLNLDASMIGRSFPLATTGVTGAGDNLFFRVTAPDTVVFGYDHWGTAGSLTAPVTVRFGEPHRLEFWLPALSPYPDLNEAELLLVLDGTPIWREPKPFNPATPAQIFPGLNAIGSSASERILENGVFEDTQLPFQPPLAPPRGPSKPKNKS